MGCVNETWGSYDPVSVREEFIVSVLLFERAEETTADFRNSKRRQRTICCMTGKMGQWGESVLFLNLIFAYRRPERSAKVSY